MKLVVSASQVAFVRASRRVHTGAKDRVRSQSTCV